jgi:hypothetical protein
VRSLLPCTEWHCCRTAAARPRWTACYARAMPCTARCMLCLSHAMHGALPAMLGLPAWQMAAWRLGSACACVPAWTCIINPPRVCAHLHGASHRSAARCKLPAACCSGLPCRPASAPRHRRRLALAAAGCPPGQARQGERLTWQLHGWARGCASSARGEALGMAICPCAHPRADLYLACTARCLLCWRGMPARLTCGLPAWHMAACHLGSACMHACVAGPAWRCLSMCPCAMRHMYVRATPIR